MRLRGWLADMRLGLATERRCRRGARPVYMGGGIVMVRALDRYTLYAPTRDLSIAPSLIHNGRFDPWTARLIARHVRAGMTVADVGANLGLFTMLMADRVGPTGRVLAFEPSDELSGLIGRSAAANRLADRIAIHPVALGEDDGREMDLLTPGDHLGGASILHAGEGLDTQPVTVRRLDAIAGAERIALAKIDVEGFEPQVWAGMAGVLAGPALRTVILEFTAGHYADPAGFVAAIRAAGFAIALVDMRRGPIPIRDETLAAFPPHHIVNLLLTR